MNEKFLLQVGYILLSYWIVNGCLNTFKYLPGINRVDRPLDGGRNFIDGRRIFGASTTLIGLPVALLSGLVLDFGFAPWYIGLLFGAAIYTGHALGSFIKRRLGWADGRFLPLVDHGDSIILAGLALYALAIVTWQVIAIAVILNYIIQPLLCFLAFKLKIRARPL